MKRRAVLFAGCAALAAVSAASLKPTRRASKDFAPIALERQVPVDFVGWRVDRSIIPVLPDPSLQGALDKIYGQTLARTYVNDLGQRVMLSIAYGEDQGTDATAAHRPEFCYAAQGFSVSGRGERVLNIAGAEVRVRRLVGSLQSRREPITYWVTLNDRAVLPGFSRKLEQIRLGLLGQIPDGMLVRVSTIANDETESFRIQEQFLTALRAALAPELRTRFFGSGTA